MTRARDERPGGDDGHGHQQDTGTPGARPDEVSEHRHAKASDARLTALLRADSPTAYQALRELRERHHPAVLAYARLCAASESSARELATQAFTVATRETARGIEPTVPWRHRLLLLTARVAAGWAGDGGATGLDPALRLVLDTTGPDGPVPPLLAAFELLPPRPQGLIWYGVVEREPDDRTAVLLGLTPDDVTYKRDSAFLALRQACLRVRLAASDDPRCQDFRRLIEESVRPDTPRHSTDLHTHMEHCAYCSGAYEELCALRDSPRATLAEGLLPWGGTAYARGGVGARDSVGARDDAGARDGTGAWDGGRSDAGAEAAGGFGEPETGAGAGPWAGAGTGTGSGAGDWAGAEAAAAAAAVAAAWAASGFGSDAGPDVGPASGSPSGFGVGSDSGSSSGFGVGSDSGSSSGFGVGSDSGGRDRAADGVGAEPRGGALAGAEAWEGPAVEGGTGAWADAAAGTATAAGRAAGAAGSRAGAGTAAGAHDGGAGASSRAGTGAVAEAGVPGAGWSPSRRFVLTSVALGVALAPLLAFLVFSGSVGSSSDGAADSVGTPATPPSGPVTPTVPQSPTPSPTPSDTGSPSKPPAKEKPTRSPSPSPSRTGLPTPSLPYGPPLNGAYAQVVNIASGLCLDIRGELEKGTDVVTATCSARATQRWRLDSHRNALQSFADPDLCLDSRGATDDGVGIWECDSLEGDNGENLRFEVDSRGVIRPAIAPGHAVTPDALGSVTFDEVSGRDGQRWRAGAGPVHA
ncbi:RICIN domain-containing protein [Streptomyces sp. NBC_00487]|uniref:RICIN domain-containing protein n=1 Tax=unclassified Streptomyces TaxID=2593676 RepID=UPI002E17B593|nr:MULTISPECIES: RICIN domain-containing protein [unclassified Streptomyces]